MRTRQRRPLFAHKGALPVLSCKCIFESAQLSSQTSHDPKRNRSLSPGAHCPVVLEPAEVAALPAAPDLAAAAAAWLVHLAHERRLSTRTIEAYGRDARQFLAFLQERFGVPPRIADFTDCAPGDLRAFLAHRRARRRSRAARCSARSPPSNRSPAISRAKAGKQPRPSAQSGRQRRRGVCLDRWARPTPRR